MARRRPAWRDVWPMAAWLVLLAALPWWLGLPLLLALAAGALLLQQRLDEEHAAWIRRSLLWGLPGMLFALQRSLGGDVFAWGAALLGALAGYTLLAGLGAWLDRDLHHAPAGAPDAEWPELAMAPIGPPVEIIELQPPQWQTAADGLIDPLGGQVIYHDGSCLIVDGQRLDAVAMPVSFSPEGRWFAGHGSRGVLLWDRQRGRQYRLRGWQLCGWYRDQPWLARRDGDMPLALPAVLGQDDED